MIKETFSAGETKKLAGRWAKQLFQTSRLKKRRSAPVFALTGNLGSGKTTFAQGFLRALGVKKKVTSPSFVLIKCFMLRASGFKLAYHIDCYRIKKPSELLKLGLKKNLADPRNIFLIEWPEKIKKLLPKDCIWLKFEHGRKENCRVIKICTF